MCASKVATSPSRPRSANKILSVENFLDFLKRFVMGHEKLRQSKLKFAGLNPEVIRLLLDKIASSKNKDFREKLEKGPFN